MPEPLSDEQLAALKAHRPAAVWQHPAEVWVTVSRLDLLALIEEVEGLRALVPVIRRERDATIADREVADSVYERGLFHGRQRAFDLVLDLLAPLSVSEGGTDG